MPKDPSEALSVLRGLRMRCVGRALDGSDDLQFSVFPNASYHDLADEFWRMFTPVREGPHYTVSANGFEIFPD